MKSYGYTHVANSTQVTQEQQAEYMRQVVEQNGFTVINTGNTMLDTRLLPMLSQKPVKQAVIIFRGQ